MRVKVISFYTEGAYEEEVKPLLASCERFALDSNIVKYRKEFLPTWNDAVCFKPRFILEKLNLWNDYDGIFWTDADSEFVQGPDFSRFERCDLSWHKFKRSRSHEEEYLTGSMFFRCTESVRTLVEEWGKVTGIFSKTDTPEQHSLKKVCEEKDRWLKFENLDASYCTFDDNVAKYPVIWHRQVSRKLRFQ